MPKIDIRPRDWEEVSRILKVHIPEYEVWAFGSRVKWTAKQYSDLDLAVISEQPLPISLSADLNSAFDESNLSIKVDIVDWAAISESFRQIVERDKVTIQTPLTGLANWKFKKLIDCTRDGNLSYGIVQPGQHDTTGIPIIRVNNIKGGQIQRGDVLRVSPDIEAKYKRTRLEGGEVLLTLVGSSGQSAVVPEELKGCNIARAIAVIRPRPEIGANWINICLQSKDVQQFLDDRANTTVQKTLNLGDVKEVPIPIPPKAVKDGIESVAMSLENKIELNRRMNETLAAIARALFKSWFVDFDPVRAKATGEAPESICRRLGLTPELLALFPDRFQESELGGTPEGWNESTLGAEAQRCGGVIQTGPFGSQLHSSDYVEKGTPVVMPQDIVERRVSTWRIARVDTAMTHKLSKHRLITGDVVYSRRGDIERHALISEREEGWLCGTGCFMLRLGSKWPSQAYLSEVLDMAITRQWLVRHAVGATMPNLNTSILKQVPIMVPPVPLLVSFESFAGPVRCKQIEANSESENCAEFRDALLPKLISGELSVPTAETAAAADA